MKPMLAVEADLSKLTYPLYAQPKLDGIRVIVKDGVVYSRSLKPIRNKHVQELFGNEDFEGYDGELIVGSPTAKDVFQKTTSGVMSADGEPDVKLYAFDLWDHEGTFKERIDYLIVLEGWKHDSPFCEIVYPKFIENEECLLQYYDQVVKEGYEGIMLRSLQQPYKFGRSTVKSQHLLKLKPFLDDEFKVVGFTERMHNTNEAVKNALGRTERSSAKEGLVPTGMLGALVLKFGDDTFECGTGFTDAERTEIWNNQWKYLGALAKIRYQELGSKGKPRFPSMIGWRDEEDL